VNFDFQSRLTASPVDDSFFICSDTRVLSLFPNGTRAWSFDLTTAGVFPPPQGFNPWYGPDVTDRVTAHHFRQREWW
jgi:hypothetical protein